MLRVSSQSTAAESLVRALRHQWRDCTMTIPTFTFTGMSYFNAQMTMKLAVFDC